MSELAPQKRRLHEAELAPWAMMHTRTVSIFRESRHVLEAIEPPPQCLLDRLYEAVRRPPGELVERHELISRALGIMRRLRLLCF